MKLTETKKVLSLYGNYVVRSAKANLTKKKKNNTGALYRSIKSRVRKYRGDLNLTFEMLGYGTFVDKGVQGTGSKNLAPKSPYRFGSGKGGGSLRAGINKWMTQRKELKGVVRDKQGKFIPRQSLQYLIVRKIWSRGIAPTMFFTNPFKNLTKRDPSKLLDAFIKDFTKDLEDEINKNPNITLK